MQTQLCDWSISNNEGQMKLTCLLWLYSAQAGSSSNRRLHDSLVFFVLWCEKDKMCLFIYMAFIWTIDLRGWNWCWMESRANRKEQGSARPYLDAAGCCDGKWNVRRGRGSRCVCNTHKHKFTFEWARTSTTKLVKLMMPIFLTSLWLCCLDFTYCTFPVLLSTQESKIWV